MYCYISFGTINVNASVQNGGVFVGDIYIPGWDANQKINSAHASTYGMSNFEAWTVNITADQRDVIDGVINDQDFKPVWGFNV